jgi:hypothetical protein
MENSYELLNMFDAKPGLFILSIDVLWLKYLFFTSYELLEMSNKNMLCSQFGYLQCKRLHTYRICLFGQLVLMSRVYDSSFYCYFEGDDVEIRSQQVTGANIRPK